MAYILVSYVTEDYDRFSSDSCFCDCSVYNNLDFEKLKELLLEEQMNAIKYNRSVDFCIISENGNIPYCDAALNYEIKSSDFFKDLVTTSMEKANIEIKKEKEIEEERLRQRHIELDNERKKQSEENRRKLYLKLKEEYEKE